MTQLPRDRSLIITNMHNQFDETLLIIDDYRTHTMHEYLQTWRRKEEKKHSNFEYCPGMCLDLICINADVARR